MQMKCKIYPRAPDDVICNKTLRAGSENTHYHECQAMSILVSGIVEFSDVTHAVCSAHVKKNAHFYVDSHYGSCVFVSLTVT